MENSSIDISESQVSELTFQYYNLKGTAKRMLGEVDLNFCLKNEDGTKFTVKISQSNSEVESIDFQVSILNHLSQSNFPLDIPEVIFSKNNNAFEKIEGNRILRVLKWVPGRMLSDANPRTEKLLHDWGRTCGLFSKHLQNFDHDFAHRFYKWDPSETLFSKKYLPYIKGESELEIAGYFWNLFENETLPQLSHLRKSINYNDAHEHNFLTDSNFQDISISGIIDFGDALYTHTINELAIACAYACMNYPDPLSAASEVVKGYHSVFPIEEKELSVLYSLISARLMITAANAVWNKHNNPENEYLVISEKPAWDLLKKWRNISKELAHYTFRNVCGLEACPKKVSFDNWIKENKNNFSEIVKSDNEKIISLNLSAGSVLLGNNSNFDSSKSFSKKINQILEEQDAKIGVGGYDECRPFYSTDAYQVNGNNGAKWRTVHLGMDVWKETGTAIFSPLDGIVFSVQNNDNERDYGPTLILEHQVSEQLTFYTLFGHLGMEVLENLSKGMTISKSQQIATIGSASDNGNWPPHLHFQIMLDLLGNEGDFPGVAFPNDREVWKSICPNPKPFFMNIYSSIKVENKSIQSSEDIFRKRKKNLGKSLSISYKNPLHIVRGFKQHLYDVTGRRFLDTVNNVPHVGHQHPRVVKAAQQQIGVLNTNTRYLNEQIVEYANELLATMPAELSVVHFVNSGSEANELALRMAEAYSGQKDVVAVEVGYHGNTNACIGVSSYKFDGKGGKGAPPHTHIVPIPDIYRGLYREENKVGKKYAVHIQQAIEKVQSEGRNISGFICESILSCGGQIVLPEGYLKEAYSYVRNAGGLCIADEVQVGFGRVGEKFWGFELQEVVPDIVTMGKPIGNGHPLAAVITSAKVAEAFANGMEYFNTFGGNPVSCAIGREVLKIVHDEELQKHALEVGNYIKKEIEKLKNKFPIIGDVRGHGLFLGFELVRDQSTLEPADSETFYLANRMRERGILMSTDGPFHNVIKIKPPMCFDEKDANVLLENLEIVFKEDFLSK